MNRRIEALSVLPIFYKLDGKRAVLIGGSAAAAWKAELLAAAGAHVDIYAPKTEQGDAHSCIERRGRRFGEAHSLLLDF